MALEMREICKKCGVGVKAAGEAYICTYECTFYEGCTNKMKSVCPDCDGELVRRPKRKA